MFWETIFWLSIGLGALLVILRIIIPMFGKSGGTASDERKGNLLTKGAVFPVIVVAIMAYSFLVKAYPEQIPTPNLSAISLFSRWSEEEKVEVEHLAASLEQYNTATLLAVTAAKTDEDWESVKALLTAALDESQMVSEEVLKQVHDEMPFHYNDYFKPGLRIGIFALDTKPSITGRMTPNAEMEQMYNDSLDASRELLTNWADWYNTNTDRIEERMSVN